MKNENIGIICQARLSSTRLPGKVLYDLGYGNSLEIIHTRFLHQFKDKYKFIIASSNSPEDKAIEYFCKEKNIDYFTGSLENVLERYYKCSLKNNLNYIVRITSDCPFVDFSPIPQMLKILKECKADYITNSHDENGHVPDGFDLEIFSFDALSRAYNLPDLLPSEEEHVTFQFHKRSNFKKILYGETPEKFTDLRLTLDEPEDYELIRKLISSIEYKKLIKLPMVDICDLILDKNLSKINSNIIKNKGWESAFEKDFLFLKNRKDKK